METSIRVETSGTIDIEGGSVPGISLPRILSRVLRTRMMFSLRKWKTFVGLCDYLGQEGGVVMNDWLMKGHGVGVLVSLSGARMGGIPA